MQFSKVNFIDFRIRQLNNLFLIHFATAIFTELSPNSRQAPTWYGLNNICPFSSNTSISCHSKIIKLFIKRSPFLF
nr:MAG TPA: hypothetical protein [Caudoviricetes sp.]